jgi:hypothetical protein
MEANQARASDLVSAAIERSKMSGEEFCNLCGEGMKFPLTTHIDEPIRYKNGAFYTEGVGQTCAACAVSKIEQ